MSEQKIVIKEYIDERFAIEYKEQHKLYDTQIARNTQKFDIPLSSSHVSKIMRGANCEIDSLIKICYASGMTPNDLVAGRWESKNVEDLKLELIKLRDKYHELEDEMKELNKELVALRGLAKYIKFTKK